MILGCYCFVVTFIVVYLMILSASLRDEVTDVTADKEKLQKELDFTKESIVGLFNKPIYATLTAVQIEQIGQIVAAKIQEPKPWLN